MAANRRIAISNSGITITNTIIIIIMMMVVSAFVLQTARSQIHNVVEAPVSITELLKSPESVDTEEALKTARHFVCIPLIRLFNLQLRAPLRVGESVAVIGDHEKLGAWQVERGIPLRSFDDSGLEWFTKVPICVNERIYYRYFIYHTDAWGHRRVIRWEGQQHARVLERYEIYRQPGHDVFGDVYSFSLMDVEEELGWLRHEYAIDFQFIWGRHIKLRPHHQHHQHHQQKQQRQQQLNAAGDAQSYRLRFVVYDANTKRPSTYAADTTIEVAKYDANNGEFVRQSETGVAYDQRSHNAEIVIFRIVTPMRARNSYELIISNEAGIELGRALILNVDMQLQMQMQSEGVLRLPIVSSIDGFDAGELQLPYQIINPMPHAEAMNFRGTFHHYWPMNWPTVHIGHRGMGKSFYQFEAPDIEGTIRSFMRVHQLNGDMIELDVQLTRDLVAIVWSDFGFYTAPYNRFVRDEFDLDYVLVKDLRYNELRQKRIFIARKSYMVEYTHLNSNRINVSERIMPRLKDVFRHLPNTLGMLIEVKWPQLTTIGLMESWQTLNKNRYVDTVIQLTQQYGCGRPVIFASFDADLCTMLRLKQNIFPVLFMTMGDGRAIGLSTYRDQRTRTFLNAVNFAHGQQLLGTAVHVETFLDDDAQDLLHWCLDLGQTVFLWGNQLNDTDTIERFTELGVSGLIYDRFDRNRPQHKRYSFFKASELQLIFSRQCLHTPNTTKSVREHRHQHRINIT